MIDALQPLTELAGVQLVMFVSEDGVPIAVPGNRSDQGPGAPGPLDATGPGGIVDDSKDLGRVDAIAAVATGWMREIRDGLGQASLREPQRIVLRGARGALVMQRARGAVLLLLLSRGLTPEDVRLPMDATVARLNRKQRAGGESTHSASLFETPGPMPSAPDALRTKDSLDVGITRDPSQN